MHSIANPGRRSAGTRRLDTDKGLTSLCAHRAYATLDFDIGAPGVANAVRPRRGSPLPNWIAPPRRKVTNDAVGHLLAAQGQVLGNGGGVA